MDELFAELERDLAERDAETARSEALRLRRKNDKAERRYNRTQSLRNIPRNLWWWWKEWVGFILPILFFVLVFGGIFTVVGVNAHHSDQKAKIEATEKQERQVSACVDAGGKVLQGGELCYFSTTDSQIELK